ncbi:hypothetical protein J4416_01880 [Candidatus Pacearchaeota archaeon]|nr:hypothetical protein [Candidatus Pacearchaeota archaeon]
MKNYVKGLLFAFVALILLSFVSSVSAYPTYSYMDVSESVSYNEDLNGLDRGFSLKHTNSVPRTNPVIGCDYYDWTSDFRKCRRTAYYGGYTEDYYGYVSGNNNLNSPYDQDKALRDAFKTYQQSSKQQYQLESKRLDLANRRYYGGYGYGGYGYGYSGARYYRYGW